MTFTRELSTQLIKPAGLGPSVVLIQEMAFCNTSSTNKNMRMAGTQLFEIAPVPPDLITFAKDLIIEYF
ncbi:hypothetical protein Pan54_06900 [Rubinisphaera italica]|uniref:Uncharacterized protein n=1 Tax=Rubinisphaera italica TaxID=2527969 RepID=A0A5C5XBG8_9PLAN|nr:hypothetical protein Pan54_06900 [Rubinisphaera italica]